MEMDLSLLVQLFKRLVEKGAFKNIYDQLEKKILNAIKNKKNIIFYRNNLTPRHFNRLFDLIPYQDYIKKNYYYDKKNILNNISKKDENFRILNNFIILNVSLNPFKKNDFDFEYMIYKNNKKSIVKIQYDLNMKSNMN